MSNSKLNDIWNAGFVGENLGTWIGMLLICFGIGLTYKACEAVHHGRWTKTDMEICIQQGKTTCPNAFSSDRQACLDELRNKCIDYGKR